MQQRGSWSSGLGFVLDAAGSAVGLGNLWKFPYITYANDGGAFVLVYLVCILIVGLPIMISEIMIGKKTQRSPVGAFREAIGERWSWIGGLGVFTGFVLLSFYSVVAGWTSYYFLQCLQWSFGSFPVEYEAGAAFGEFIARGPMQVGLAGAFMLVTIVVVSLGVSSGIERAARILLPILLGILLLLLVSALRMEGAKAALAFLFRPDFGELTAHSLLEALGHAFFTLSLGMGAMITYGSYMDRRESTVRSAGWVVVLDTVIAMLATVIMFSVIFTDPPTRASVGESTAGMLFITLPKLFYSIVPGGAFLAPLFYLLVGFAALTSTVSLLEVVSSYFIDERKTPRKRHPRGRGGLRPLAGGVGVAGWGPAALLRRGEDRPLRRHGPRGRQLAPARGRTARDPGRGLDHVAGRERTGADRGSPGPGLQLHHLAGVHPLHRALGGRGHPRRGDRGLGRLHLARAGDRRRDCTPGGRVRGRGPLTSNGVEMPPGTNLGAIHGQHRRGPAGSAHRPGPEADARRLLGAERGPASERGRAEPGAGRDRRTPGGGPGRPRGGLLPAGPGRVRAALGSG